MVLSPEKCHFMLFGVKENELFDLICNDITLKHCSHEKNLGIAIDNKLSFDEHIINNCKTANKKLSALSRINHYMKQKQNKGNIIAIIHNLSFQLLSLIWMLCSKKSTKRINAVHEKFLQIILKYYESPYTLLLEEAH